MITLEIPNCFKTNQAWSLSFKALRQPACIAIVYVVILVKIMNFVGRSKAGSWTETSRSVKKRCTFFVSTFRRFCSQFKIARAFFLNEISSKLVPLVTQVSKFANQDGYGELYQQFKNVKEQVGNNPKPT